jgi:hypothetical protein
MQLAESQLADHCTRCRSRFGRRAVRHMVSVHIVCEVLSGMAVTRNEIAPVCAACVSAAERVALTQKAKCVSCGCTMLSKPPRRAWSLSAIRPTCSSRCAQRMRRQRRRSYRYRPKGSSVCKICKTSFTPKRTDARYCSGRCRQQAYRIRASGL